MRTRVEFLLLALIWGASFALYRVAIPELGLPLTLLDEPFGTLDTAARDALRGHDSARALATLDEHQRRFPHAALATEATAVRILALCAQRRADEARALARSWFATAGQSPLAANLRQSCAGDAP